MSLMIYAVTFALVGIAIFFINKFDKTKTTQDVLTSINKEF